MSPSLTTLVLVRLLQGSRRTRVRTFVLIAILLVFYLVFLDLVQQGISPKIPTALGFLAAFVTGFILAYIQQWKLALAMTSIVPMISITFGLMNKFITKYMQESLKHIGEGGTLAEEVISTIRTSHAFGSQNLLTSLYNNYVLKARAVDLKSAVWQGSSLGVMFFAIYASYALAFQFGTTLINSGEGMVFPNS
jgi:ATP-binding cassette subfamily B (MDR/TAP) protein 1